MAPSPPNKKLDNGSLQDTYAVVRTWYQDNIDKVLSVGDHYRQASAPLIRALPTAVELSDVEIIAVFREVIAGRLEWGYPAMGEYARAALNGRSYNPTPEDTLQLQKSVLWPFIKRD